MKSKYDDTFNELIYIYSRSQAIEDGELIDVSKIAIEVGFKLPTAVTRTVWDLYVNWTTLDNEKQTHQDVEGRLWDILWMLYLACKRSNADSFLKYQLQVIPRDGSSKSTREIELKAVISGGDIGEAVITIMLPDED